MEKEFNINKDKCKLYSFITVLQMLFIEVIIFILLIYIRYLDINSLLVLSIFPVIFDIIIFVLYYQKLITRRVSVTTNELRYYIDEYNHLSSTVDNKYINFFVKEGSVKKIKNGIININLKGDFIKTENGISKKVRKIQIPNIIDEYNDLVELLKKSYIQKNNI